MKDLGLNDGFSFEGRSGSCGCVLDWFYLYGDQESMGFGISALEGLSPRLSRTVHYSYRIVIISMSLFSKEYLISLVE